MIGSNATASLYLALNSASRAVIEPATLDPAELGKAQERIDELMQWRKILVTRPESVALQHAIHEATIGLFLTVSGLYRPAFVALRLFVELSLGSVHFSVNRLELAEWLQGRRDINWAGLIDPDNGVLSVRHANAFFPELRGSVTTYNAIGSKIYRELSEFVHGNHHTWGSTNDQIAFDSDLQAKWLSHFSAASTVANFALSLRFLKELAKPDIVILSPIVNSSLGHVEAIRDYLRKPIG
jgi:hypothetical protein